MIRFLFVILMFASTSTMAAEKWKAVAWTFTNYFSESGDLNDGEKKDEVEYATEEECLEHLRSISDTMISTGFEIQLELARFDQKHSKVSGEPFWRILLHYPKHDWLQSYVCQRKVLFTLVKDES